MPRGIVELLEKEGDALEAQGYTPHFIAQGTREGRPEDAPQDPALRHPHGAPGPGGHAAPSRSGLPELIKMARGGHLGPQVAFSRRRPPLGPSGPVLQPAPDRPASGARDALYFLTVGSKNQDLRGAFLDGETSYVVAGRGASPTTPTSST